MSENNGRKAAETRRRNSELRKAREEEARTIREKMTAACLRVLDDESASSADMMKAVEILHDLSKRRWNYG